MIKRVLAQSIEDSLFKGKAIILLGARQVGKTTLLEQIFNNREQVLNISGDSIDIHSLFESATAERLQLYFGNYKIVIIDEAQLIPNIGLRLKLITDYIKHIQLIATGSSSFELANKLNESLTGRKWQINMYPISFAEMVQHHGLIAERRSINHRLVFGYYPDVVVNVGNERQVLKQLTDSYLYKDIFRLDNINKPDKLVKLLQAIAYQVGSQVSYNELAQTCGLDSKTVEKYIQMLEQAYVIFRLGSYSKNLRNELKFSRKIYFFDNGVRNALISNFEILEKRTDIGVLWENFLVSERYKVINYNNYYANTWFWRTTEGQEVDYLEEINGKIAAYEFKWNENKSNKISVTFQRNYPNIPVSIVHPGNFETFLL
jgi:predicted AAA+ superfamily ATPase